MHKFLVVLVVLMVLLPVVGICEPSEFRVNTYTINNQSEPGASSCPRAAMDSNGNFVVTWDSWEQDGQWYGIYAQKYNNNGSKNGGEFRVNTTTEGTQERPMISMNIIGNFVITWFAALPETGNYDIYAQIYNSDGSKKGGEFKVNTSTYGSQTYPSAAMDNVGNFIIVWLNIYQNGGIFAQKFDNDGNPIDGEFQVSNSGNYPSIAMDSIGDFVITWGSIYPAYDIYAKRYDNNGNPVGGEFQVNTYTQGMQQCPLIAMDNAGDFVITWRSELQDGSGFGVYAQRYNNNGNPIGDEFQVNTSTEGDQLDPAVAMDSDGNFIIAWTNDIVVGDYDGYYSEVCVQKYNSDGSKNGGEFQVNDFTENNQSGPSIAMISSQKYVFAWGSYNQYSSNSMFDVYAKLWTDNPPPNAIILEWFEAEAGYRCVVLDWKTGTEIDTLGFYLMRSENLIDYNLVNEQIIPAQGNAYSGHSYLYIDDQISSGRVYHYWLVDVDVYGEYKIHGPVKVITYLEEVK